MSRIRGAHRLLRKLHHVSALQLQSPFNEQVPGSLFGFIFLKCYCTCLIVLSKIFKQPPRRPQSYPEHELSQTAKLAMLHRQSRAVPRIIEAPQTNNDNKNFPGEDSFRFFNPLLNSSSLSPRCSLHHYSFCLISLHLCV